MEQTAVSHRRPCFVEDDGLASLAGMDAPGFSGNNNNTNNHYWHEIQNHHPYSGPSMMMRRRNSLRSISCLTPPPSSSVPSGICSPGSARFYEPRFEDFQSPHFLQACSLCKKPLGDNRDIFMYRGDTPFCSEECRQEQIEIDEAKEKKRNYKAMRSKKESTKTNASSASSSSTTASPTKNQNYPFRTGTVAAA